MAVDWLGWRALARAALRTIYCEFEVVQGRSHAPTLLRQLFILVFLRIEAGCSKP